MNGKLRYIWPNLLTFLSSASALAALYVAYFLKDRACAYFLLLSGIFDALDGPVAHWLDARSRFGNFYDSMSDFLAFGIAPALSLVFLDLMHPIIAAFYIVAIQYRLTRYSSSDESETDEKFFRGLAAPDSVYVGLLLAYLPYSNFDLAFSAAGVLAIYPGKLVPKGFRIIKIILGIAATLLFIYGGDWLHVIHQ